VKLVKVAAMNVTHEKIHSARNEIADALYIIDHLLGRRELITSTGIAEGRRKLSQAIAKLVSAESEMALIEERNRK
jgi:hypothetical protein